MVITVVVLWENGHVMAFDPTGQIEMEGHYRAIRNSILENTSIDTVYQLGVLGESRRTVARATWAHAHGWYGGKP